MYNAKSWFPLQFSLDGCCIIDPNLEPRLYASITKLYPLDGQVNNLQIIGTVVNKYGSEQTIVAAEAKANLSHDGDALKILFATGQNGTMSMASSVTIVSIAFVLLPFGLILDASNIDNFVVLGTGVVTFDEDDNDSNE